jgi:hypothetical protein
LRHFDPTDWDGPDPLEQWCAARSAYMLANGWWPGDELDELRERARVKLRHWSNRDHEEEPGDPETPDDDRLTALQQALHLLELKKQLTPSGRLIHDRQSTGFRA